MKRKEQTPPPPRQARSASPLLLLGAAPLRVGDYVPTTPKSVRYNPSGTANYTLVHTSGQSFEGMTNPGSTPVSAAALTVLKKYGLFPVASTGLGGDGFYLNVEGERLAIRGGSWYDAASSGVFALYLNGARSHTSANVGSRPAFVL